MKRNTLKQLAEMAENALLKEEAKSIKGGESFNPTVNTLIICGTSNALVYCPGNVCDPTNLGACPGNTVGGGPGTCPL